MARKAKLGFSDQATTLVARDTLVTGDIQFRGSLEVEGHVTGNIVGEPVPVAIRAGIHYRAFGR